MKKTQALEFYYTGQIDEKINTKLLESITEDYKMKDYVKGMVEEADGNYNLRTDLASQISGMKWAQIGDDEYASIGMLFYIKKIGINISVEKIIVLLKNKDKQPNIEEIIKESSK